MTQSGSAFRNSRGYVRLALSPDGRRLATARGEEGANRDIWLTMLSGDSDTRFTFEPAEEDYPVWSPDGGRIAFSSNRGGSYGLFQHLSNGAGEDELLFKSDHVKFPTSWSRDGRFLLYYDIDPNAKRDLWVLPMDGQGTRKPVVFLQTPFNEDNATFSPDAHWIAYHSDESGRDEVYVRPFPVPPGGGGKWMISQGGGRFPLWRGDGKELFYLSDEGDLMAAPVSAAGAAFQPGTPKALFKAPTGSAGVAVTSDGQKFLVTAPEFESQQIPTTIVLNWTSLLKKQQHRVGHYPIGTLPGDRNPEWFPILTVNVSSHEQLGSRFARLAEPRRTVHWCRAQAEHERWLYRTDAADSF